jgi:putative ABC transport system ATP-binding protein
MLASYFAGLLRVKLPIPQPGAKAVMLTDVRKVYVTGAGEFLALKGINLEVAAGEFVAILGKSGSGKSTLVNMITGIDRPSQGEVWVAGTPVNALSENQIAVWRGRTVGVVFQFFQLLPTLTALENVMLPMDFCNVFTAAHRPERAMRLLQMVGVADQAAKIPASLSGGQQQRVAIARALANDPLLLVADEPTGNLDAHTATAVIDLFHRLAQGGKTIIMVTHDQDLARRATRILTVAEGQVLMTNQGEGG